MDDDDNDHDDDNHAKKSKSKSLSGSVKTAVMPVAATKEATSSKSVTKTVSFAAPSSAAAVAAAPTPVPPRIDFDTNKWNVYEVFRCGASYYILSYTPPLPANPKDVQDVYDKYSVSPDDSIILPEYLSTCVLIVGERPKTVNEVRQYLSKTVEDGKAGRLKGPDQVLFHCITPPIRTYVNDAGIKRINLPKLCITSRSAYDLMLKMHATRIGPAGRKAFDKITRVDVQTALSASTPNLLVTRGAGGIVLSVRMIKHPTRCIVTDPNKKKKPLSGNTQADDDEDEGDDDDASGDESGDDMKEIDGDSIISDTITETSASTTVRASPAKRATISVVKKSDHKDDDDDEPLAKKLKSDHPIVSKQSAPEATATASNSHQDSGMSMASLLKRLDDLRDDIINAGKVVDAKHSAQIEALDARMATVSDIKKIQDELSWIKASLDGAQSTDKIIATIKGLFTQWQVSNAASMKSPLDGITLPGSEPATKSSSAPPAAAVSVTAVSSTSRTPQSIIDAAKGAVQKQSTLSSTSQPGNKQPVSTGAVETAKGTVLKGGDSSSKGPSTFNRAVPSSSSSFNGRSDHSSKKPSPVDDDADYEKDAVMDIGE
jgi:hypothetical protein